MGHGWPHPRCEPQIPPNQARTDQKRTLFGSPEKILVNTLLIKLLGENSVSKMVKKFKV